MRFEITRFLLPSLAVAALAGCTGVPAASGPSGMTVRQMANGDHLALAAERQVEGGMPGAYGYASYVSGLPNMWYGYGGTSSLSALYSYDGSYYPMTYAYNNTLYGLSYCPTSTINYSRLFSAWGPGCTANVTWLPAFAPYHEAGCFPRTSTLTYAYGFFAPQTCNVQVGSNVSFYNPTGNPITMTCRGTTYTVPAGGTTSLSYRTPGIYSYTMPHGGQTNVSVTAGLSH